MHYVLTQALSATIFTITAGVVTALVLTPFRRGLRKLWRVVDALDPATDTQLPAAAEDTDPGDIPLEGLRHFHGDRQIS